MEQRTAAGTGRSSIALNARSRTAEHRKAMSYPAVTEDGAGPAEGTDALAAGPATHPQPDQAAHEALSLAATGIEASSAAIREAVAAAVADAVAAAVASGTVSAVAAPAAGDRPRGPSLRERLAVLTALVKRVPPRTAAGALACVALGAGGHAALTGGGAEPARAVGPAGPAEPVIGQPPGGARDAAAADGHGDAAHAKGAEHARGEGAAHAAPASASKYASPAH